MPSKRANDPTARRIRRRAGPLPEPEPEQPRDPKVKETRAQKKARHSRENRERNAERSRKNSEEQIKCRGKTLQGRKCRSFALADNDGYCMVHGPKAEENKAKAAEGARRARLIRQQQQPKPHELMRQVIESNPILFLKPYLEAIGIHVEMVPDEIDPELVHPVAIQDPTSNGAVLYGVSKDGDVVISQHKDIEAQQKAVERLMDRVYGKPKQTNIIAGPSASADPQLVPFDAERQAEIRDILASAAPAHADPANTSTNGHTKPPAGNGELN